MQNRFLKRLGPLGRAVGAGLALGLLMTPIACNVEVEEEGRLPDVSIEGDAGQLPDYDIVQKEEGRLPSVDVDVDSGKLPEVEIEGPDVSVGTTTIEVPTIDVDIPDDDPEALEEEGD